MSDIVPTPSSVQQSQNTVQIQQVESNVPAPEVKPNIFMQSLPVVVLFLFFYFIIIRPQSKKAKEVAKMVNEMKIGNKILTTGGIYGVITEIDKEGDLIKVEISKNVRIVIAKSAIASVFKSEDINL